MKIMKKLKCEDLPETDGVWEFHPLGKYWVSKAPAGAHNSLGPAVIYVNGEKRWYVNDILHRLDGPAIEYSSGSIAWYINGHRYLTQEAFRRAVIEYLLRCDNVTALVIKELIEKST